MNDKPPRTTFTHTFKLSDPGKTTWVYCRARNNFCQWVINIAEKCGKDWSTHPWLTKSTEIDIGKILAIRMKIEIDKIMMQTFYQGKFK